MTSRTSPAKKRVLSTPFSLAFSIASATASSTSSTPQTSAESSASTRAIVPMPQNRSSTFSRPLRRAKSAAVP